jgi:hypothetical protein
MASEDKRPILRGHLDSSGRTIRVFCPYCDTFHTHGWPEGTSPRAIEHRNAHCHTANPYRESGYYIALFKREDSGA